jgi:hypothetical protein
MNHPLNTDPLVSSSRLFAKEEKAVYGGKIACLIRECLSLR